MHRESGSRSWASSSHPILNLGAYILTWGAPRSPIPHCPLLGLALPSFSLPCKLPSPGFSFPFFPPTEGTRADLLRPRYKQSAFKYLGFQNLPRCPALSQGRRRQDLQGRRRPDCFLRFKAGWAARHRVETEMLEVLEGHQVRH
jgi:hypothetical protein